MHPADQLKMEHENILRGLKLLDQTSRQVHDGVVNTDIISLLIDFFKGYADQGHHAKEEEIFFEYLYKSDESFRGDFSPIAVFREDHVRGRSLVQEISKVDHQYPLHVNDYNIMLKRHIEMEDEIFPMLMESKLSDEELRKMSAEFNDADAQRDVNGKLALLDKVEVMI